MEVALPGRELSVVGRPDGLQGDGRSAATAGGAELVLLEIPLALDDRVRQANGGLLPVGGPPVAMRGQGPVESGVEDTLDALLRARVRGSGDSKLEATDHAASQTPSRCRHAA